MSKIKVRGYVTPKGVDEREIVPLSEEEAEAMKRAGVKCIRWHGANLLQGGQYSIEIFNEISSRLKKNKGCIIIITGDPGQGKTYFAIRLCQIFDPEFDMEKQVAFTREHSFKVFSEEIKLEPGQGVVLDESHFGFGARSWTDQDQRDLTNLIAAARSRGLLICLVILHASMVDRILRDHIPNFQIYLEKPGTGIIYKYFSPRFAKEPSKKRLGEMRLLLPDYELCAYDNCLLCRYCFRKENPCMVPRARYERRKREFLANVSESAADRAKEAKKRADVPSGNKLLEFVYQNKDKLEYTARGNLDYTSIIDVLDGQGWSIGRTKAEGLVRRLVRKYPELKRQQEDV